MHALILQHVDVNPPGIWADALDDAGVDVTVARPDLDGVPRDLCEHDLVVALGGPQSACAGAAPDWLEDEIAATGQAVRAGVPFLGVCLGAQVLARAAGGECRPSGGFALGLVDVGTGLRARFDPVFAALGRRLTAFSFHGDACSLPSGVRRLAASATCDVEALRWGATAYGVQFHLEATAADVATWLDLLPWLADHPALAAGGGCEGFLERHAAAVPAMRDAAVGITRRWLAAARDTDPATPTRSRPMPVNRLTSLDLDDPFGIRGRPRVAPDVPPRVVPARRGLTPDPSR